jgi:hypothetical protein
MYLYPEITQWGYNKIEYGKLFNRNCFIILLANGDRGAGFYRKNFRILS